MARLLVSQAGTLELDTDYFYDSEPGAEGHGTLDDMDYSAWSLSLALPIRAWALPAITIEDNLITYQYLPST